MAGHQSTSADAEGGYGSKTIGMKSSMCLIVNNIMGPAMVALPFMAQSAGWCPLVLVNLACCICSGLSSAMLCEALQRIPGNFYFTGQNPETAQRYEFCDAVKFYWGRKWSVCVRILFNVSLLAQNIPAMVVSCQVLDDFFSQIFGHVYGMRYDVFPPHVGDRNSNDQFVVTLGVVSCMLICIPFGCLNLDQNKTFQNLSFICLILLSAEFLVQFSIIGPLEQGRPLVFSRTPWATSNQAKTLGVILFSWCFPTTLPSWVNEKKPSVKVTWVVWLSVLFGFFCKVSVALFGAWAYELVHRKDQQDAQNILLVMDHVSSHWLTKASAYMFNFSTLIPGIPVISVIVRYNLLSSGGCGPASASLFGVVLPWVITVLLYRTSLFVAVLNWSAMLCMGPVNFIIPPLVFVSAIRRYNSASPVRSMPVSSHALDAIDGLPIPDPKDCSFVFSGESCSTTVEESGIVRDTSSQVSVIAVPPALRISRAQLAQAVAIVMASLVSATILLNLYFLVVLQEDIVD